MTKAKKIRPVYMDHAAATPLDAKVLKAMLPFFDKTYANPSSLHSVGQEAGKHVAVARKEISAILNAHADEMIFTSGGTESDSLAITGVLEAVPKPQLPHVITSAIEHPAVLEPLTDLERKGKIELTVIKPSKQGIVSAQEVVSAIKPNTVLISVMYANNEIGTIQPIGDIGRALLKYRSEHKSALPYFHTDACQAAGYLDLNVEKLHVDLMSINGGKIYGPKGTGLLFVRRGTKIAPVQRGGGQERGLRSGTENVPGIIGLSKALSMADGSREKESKRLIALRDRLVEGLSKIPKSRVNGHLENRLPNNVNISFMDIEGEAAMLYLDAKGIACSTGSACASSSLDPSHVILALGVSYEAAHGSLRFSLGRSTTRADVDYVVREMLPIVEMLRKISPVSLDMSHF